MDIGPCPCGLKRNYDECCGLVHANGAGLGATAESLMRARYSAYVLEDAPFLLSSWHATTRPSEVIFSADVEWLGLQVVAVDRGSAFDQVGQVEFKARFRRHQERLELHERSIFERVDGRWLYKDGLAP